MLITESKLRSIIRSLLLESFKSEDDSVIKGIVRELNFASKKIIDEFDNKEDVYKHIINKLDSVVTKSGFGFDYLDEGAFRAVYAVPNQEWVLKLASNLEGAQVNKNEADLGSGVHGTGARNIFVKVYDFDKVNDLPGWIICQRVIPLPEVEDFELFKKVFPTFWNFLNSVTSDDLHMVNRAKIIMSDHYHFTGFVSDMIRKCIVSSQKVKVPTKDDKGWDYLYKKQKAPTYSHLSYKGFNEKMIYDVVYKYFKGNILPFKDINFEQDIRKLSQGLSYVGTTDLHDGNIGIIKSNNPSPDDIVILDFDVKS